MHINLTILPDRGSLWTSNYHMDLHAALTESGHVVNAVNVQPLVEGEIFTYPECDVWFVDASMDITLPRLVGIAKKDGVKIVGHAQIGPEITRIIYPWRDEAIKRTSEVIGELDALYFHHGAHNRAFKEFYSHVKLPPTFITGFPLNLSRYTPVKGDGTILFPHSFTYMKQPILASIMLEQHKDKTIFCTGWRHDHSDEQYVNYTLLRDSRFRVRTKVRGYEYQQLLDRASVVVCTSIAETGCIAVVEGVLSGALPVVPDLPEFEWYPEEFRYKPYDISSFRNVLVRNMVEKPEFPLGEVKRRHDHRAVAHRMMSAIGDLVE